MAKDGYLDKEITSNLEKIASNHSLTLYCLYTSEFCVKRNQDKFLT